MDLLVILIIAPGLLGISLLYCYWQITRLPRNRPERYVKQNRKDVIVFAGDSITHGQVGENYVSLVAQSLNLNRLDIVNAGINSHLAWNLLQRVDEIIDTEPSFVTILIGTNDANAATSEKEANSYFKRMDLPQTPTLQWFAENLEMVVKRIQEGTDARIALISIPPLGEEKDHSAFIISSNYCKAIEEVAKTTGVTYLPFHEKMVEFLERQPGHPNYPIERSTIGMLVACFKYYVLKRDWNSIGQAAGFQLHIDYLHLNTRGATMLSDLITDFVGSFA
jgi:lysophospholipase L1-like esterase